MTNDKYDHLLYDEILVDCKNHYEEKMSWLCHVEDVLHFPFEASIKIKKQKGGELMKKVRVLNMSAEDSNFDRNFNLCVEIEFDEYIIEAPLSKLDDVVATEKTTEIIEIWKYWINK